MLFVILLLADSIVTDCYRSFSLYDVAHHDGSFYVLNRVEDQVDVFQHGKGLVRRFGGKGQAPGELMFLRGFSVLKDRIYVVGHYYYNEFSLDGEFKKKGKLPYPEAYFLKLSEGWFFYDYKLNAEIGKAYWVDDNFENEIEVVAWKNESFVKDMFKFYSQKKLPFRPMKDLVRVLPSHDRNKVYISTPGDFRLHIFDVTQKKVVKIVKKNFVRTVFDENYGREALEEINKIKPMFTADFPKYAPIVLNMALNSDGHVWFTLLLDKLENADYIMFDVDGNEVAFDKKSYPVQKRLITKLGDKSFVVNFNNDEGFYEIAIVPTKDVASFVENNPIIKE